MTAPTPREEAVSGDSTSTKGFSVASVPPRVWVALGLLVVAVVFVTQNRDVTEIQLLFISLTAPLWGTLAVSVCVGLAIGLLLRPSERRKRKGSRR
ncbi:LapA family protein [Nocardiopsis metallicus]|uniref:Putative integral membrane protein n=1 Tax=Nocardiopsis metallicus TaxID=179819 RepID=A0A840W3U8_9ACTN|nr:LapA family protein [Nocardiopsis metallicus]MBB5490654.1 putative integral membrane protein [Nocardiopsis metallicus]